MGAIAVLVLAALQAPAGHAADLWLRGLRIEAVESLQRELESRPRDGELRLRLAALELAIHRPKAALAHLEPLGDRAGPLLGEALFRLDEFERALPHLGDSIEHAWMRLDALEALGRLQECEPALERFVKLAGEDDPRVLVARGRSLARAGDHRRAIDAFRGALEQDPLHPSALFGLGQSLVRAGAREEGLRWLAEHRRVTPLLDQLDFAVRGVDLAPKHGPNHAAVGDAERALGRIDRAEAAYLRARSLSRGAELVPIVLRHARLLAEDRDSIDRAVELLDATAAGLPDPRLWVRAGDLLAHVGRTSEARARFETAWKLRPGDPGIARRLAQVGEREPAR